MNYAVVLLTLLPALSFAADATSSSNPPRSSSANSRAGKAPAAKRSVAGAPAQKKKPPLGVDRSDTSWRFDLGYGFTRESMKYDATASSDSPALPGYGSTSTSASSSGGAGSLRLDFGPMYGVHPASRGESNGFLWGVDIAIASYKSMTSTLPATDADLSGTSQNGQSFQSESSVQTFAVGLPVGWAWDIDPQWSLETLGFFHVGVLHAKYTSGENLVYGRNAPLGLFRNDLYNLYFDLGAKVNLAFRFANGFETLGTIGYLFGQSTKGTLKDQVTFYQGAANGQTGSYEESLSYKVSGAYVTVGGGWAF